MAILPSLSIVLPCHNEAANVGTVVSEALRFAPAVAADFEVVVVDDGSVDATTEEAHRAGGARVEVVRHQQNRGYGAALRSGFLAARSRWVFYTDADRQFSLEHLPRFVEQRGDNDIVVGYRQPRADGCLRVLMGRAWSAATDLVLQTGVRDVNCAYKLFPRRLFDRIELESEGALIDAEVLSKARRLGLRVAECPVPHRARMHGRASGLAPAVVARAVHELVSAR